MNVEVLAIGDELLIGQTINTNAAWIGQEMSLRGYQVLRSIAIEDKPEAIIHALENRLPQTNCVIITGGLGPTKDDLTKYTLASYFESPLEIHQATLSQIETFFKSRKGRFYSSFSTSSSISFNISFNIYLSISLSIGLKILSRFFCKLAG